MAKPIDTEALYAQFRDYGFVVKEFAPVPDDGICRLEWNYPTIEKANAMRFALAQNGADVQTCYQVRVISDRRGELLQRERALIPFATDDDLRTFFIKAFEGYREIVDGTTASNREVFGQSGVKKEPSYRPPERPHRRVGA